MELKLISARFPGKCRICGNSHTVGARIYWAKGEKPVCFDCGKSASRGENPPAAVKVVKRPKQTGKYDPDFVIDWAELRPMLVTATDPSNPTLTGWNRPALAARFVNEFRGTSFHGFTKGQVHRWMTEGYKTEAIQGLAGLAPTLQSKRRSRFVEDGDELHIDRVFAGEDRYMSKTEKREIVAGVRLNFELDASANSDKALFPYQAWMAQSIYALESSGIDCEVGVYTLSRSLFQNQPKTCRQMVRVKRFGEIADFAGFSAMFSPAAFRGIMFSTFALHADRQGLSVRGYGSGVTTKWGVTYDSPSRTINVSCDWQAKEFPAMEMTRQLRVAIQAMQDDKPN